MNPGKLSAGERIDGIGIRKVLGAIKGKGRE